MFSHQCSSLAMQAAVCWTEAGTAGQGAVMVTPYMSGEEERHGQAVPWVNHRTFLTQGFPHDSLLTFCETQDVVETLALVFTRHKSFVFFLCAILYGLRNLKNSNHTNPEAVTIPNVDNDVEQELSFSAARNTKQYCYIRRHLFLTN